MTKQEPSTDLQSPGACGEELEEDDACAAMQRVVTESTAMSGHHPEQRRARRPRSRSDDAPTLNAAATLGLSNLTEHLVSIRALLPYPVLSFLIYPVRLHACRAAHKVPRGTLGL